MKIIINKCDIFNKVHKGEVRRYEELGVIFDYDQEDGKSKMEPYLQRIDLDVCDSCMKYMLKNKRYIYGYGAMGHNTYSL